MLHGTPLVLQVATSQAPAQCSALLPLLEKAICYGWLTAASMPLLTLTALDHQAPVQCTTPPLLAITKYCQEFKSTLTRQPANHKILEMAKQHLISSQIT